MLLAGLTNAWAEGRFGVANPCSFVQGFSKASVDLVITDNSDNQQYIAWQAKITLPTGLSYNTYEVGDINAPAHTTGTLVTESAGVITITVTSSPGTPFTASEGRLMRIYLNVADDASGDKTLSLHDVELTKYGNVAQPVSAFNYDVTIGNTITLDETETSAPAAISNVKVTVKRKLKANVWNTIVLPFDISSGQIAAVFGAGTEVASFSGADVTLTDGKTTGIKVNFTSLVGDMKAHTPYIIKVLSGLAQFTVESAAITTSSDPSINKGGEDDYFKFVGTYTTNTDIPDGGLYLMNNKFKYSSGSSKLKAFRGYFNFWRKLSGYRTASAPAITLDVDGISTGISSATLDDKAGMPNEKYYTVQGLQVSQPKRGLYIVNGKKMIVK